MTVGFRNAFLIALRTLGCFGNGFSQERIGPGSSGTPEWLPSCLLHCSTLIGLYRHLSGCQGQKSMHSLRKTSYHLFLWFVIKKTKNKKHKNRKLGTPTCRQLPVSCQATPHFFSFSITPPIFGKKYSCGFFFRTTKCRILWPSTVSATLHLGCI